MQFCVNLCSIFQHTVLSGCFSEQSVILNISEINDNTSSDEFVCCVQDSLVQFYQLQMSVHHPQDAVDEASGAFAVDWDVWKVSLVLYFSRVVQAWHNNILCVQRMMCSVGLNTVICHDIGSLSFHTRITYVRNDFPKNYLKPKNDSWTKKVLRLRFLSVRLCRSQAWLW